MKLELTKEQVKYLYIHLNETYDDNSFVNCYLLESYLIIKDAANKIELEEKQQLALEMGFPEVPGV